MNLSHHLKRIAFFVTRAMLFALPITMIASAADLAKSPCPDDMVLISPGSSVCIDRFEFPNKPGAMPVINASGYEAKRWCELLDRRICLIDEWQKACRGPDGSPYPWGSARPTWEPGEDLGLTCNFGKVWMPPNEEKVAAQDKEEIERLDQSEPSGHRSMCISESGAYDMIGNAEEWVRCPGKGQYGWCLMGRFWSQLYSCEQTVSVHAPNWHYYETGFRCCKDI